MPSGHPEGLPDLFLDRSLGRVQVPTLLRAAGLRVRTLAEEYGMPADESVTDVDWLAHAGRNGGFDFSVYLVGQQSADPLAGPALIAL